MIRNIQIQPVLNGFVVSVGCQTIVFSNKETMVSQLSDYLDDPEITEKKFVAKACNRKHTLLDTIGANQMTEAPSHPMSAFEPSRY